MISSKRIISVLLLIVIGINLCGFSLLDNTTFIMDTDVHKIYKYTTVDIVYDDFSKDEKKAVNDYNNNYFLLSGKIESIKKNSSGLTIIGAEEISKIVCLCDKTIRENVNKYNAGDKVALFGKMSIDPFDKEKHFAVEKIINSPTSIKSTNIYYTLDGKMYDYSDTIEKSLSQGRVKYHIPSKWKEIEVDIKENNIGTIEGYQYVLNKTKGNENNEPESFFICYFDKKKLKEENDIKKYALVDKAIIKNIEDRVDKFPTKKTNTYYGQKYKYYAGKYKDTLLEVGTGYRTEYVFMEDGDKGIVMLLYVYRDKDSKYISDVMFVSRFLTIGK